MNWTVSEVKRRGRDTMKAGYWKCVLVALITILIGGGVGVVGNIPTTTNANFSFNSSASPDPESDEFTEQLLESYGVDTDEIESLMNEITRSPYAGTIIAAVIGVFAFVWIISILISIFLLTPLNVGCMKFYKEAGEHREYNISHVGFAFSSSYMNVVKIMFLVSLKIFLWTLLLIIPGIIKTYEYRMIPYLLADDPGMASGDAFARSREMMSGNKWHSFLLDLSFIGWLILSAFTFGVLFLFYVSPYMSCAQAELYLTLRGGVQPAGNGGYNNGTYGRTSYAEDNDVSGSYSYSGGSYGGNGYGSVDDGGNSGYGSYGSCSAPSSSGSSYGHSTYDDDDTPAFGDDRNKKSSHNDNPFNVPY